MKERLILRAALIVSKNLSRWEHFKEFVRKFQSTALPDQVEERLKAEIDGYIQNNALERIELKQALLTRNGHDPDVLADNYLSHLCADQPLELRVILSQIGMESDFLLDVPTSIVFDGEQLQFSDFPVWNTENLTNTELQTEIEQTVARFFEELDTFDQILTEQLGEVAPLLEQLRSLDDANVSSESSTSAIASEAAEAISEIVDAVSNVPDDELKFTLWDSIEKIIEYNLDPADVKDALLQEITRGTPSTFSDSFDPQAMNNCAIVLSKVIAAQFGIHVPEGVLTLYAILDGKLEFSAYDVCRREISNYCLEPDQAIAAEGTLVYVHLTQTLWTLGVPVDIDYNATRDEIAAKLAEGKAVMVTLDVSPIWPGQSGIHVVQVLSIDENGKVTTLDTGSRDSNNEPDGNHKVYDLEAFEKARELGGSIMVSTKEARPLAATEGVELTQTSNVNSEPAAQQNADGDINLAAEPEDQDGSNEASVNSDQGEAQLPQDLQAKTALHNGTEKSTDGDTQGSDTGQPRQDLQAKTALHNGTEKPTDSDIGSGPAKSSSSENPLPTPAIEGNGNPDPSESL